MGFLSGDPVGWQRWWLPEGTQPVLHDGLLPDPLVGSQRWLNRGLIRLSETSDRSARVLLADGGYGKSHELQTEIERLRDAGEYVATVDLGELTSAADVRDAIASITQDWEQSGTSGDLILALDAFDEPLVDLTNLVDVLRNSLGKLDRDRLRLLIVSRPAAWSRSLKSTFVDWWGSDEVVTLHLQPLSESDIGVAARSDDIDPDAFLGTVRRAGALPLAARPFTLRLLLAAQAQGEIPTRQLDVYRVGVAALAAENAERRIERRRTGTPLDRRLTVARRLATLSLLTGRATILWRKHAGQAANELALDEVATNPDDLRALEDVWDSALLSGSGEDRRWCHHSVAEYLCAEELAELPVETAWSLLAAPGDPGWLRPQLEATAAWTAAISTDMFDRMLEHDPKLLLTSDLRGRSMEDRERVGRAVIGRLRADEPLLERGALDALVYPGLDDDLRELLEQGQPGWRRRDALFIAFAVGTRSLDDVLLALVDDARAHTEYDEQVEIAAYASHVLADAEDDAVLARMTGQLADPETPVEVRAGLISSLFPAHLDAAGLAQLVPVQDRFHQPMARRLAYTMRTALTNGLLTATSLLPWFEGLPRLGQGVYLDQSVRELVQGTTAAALVDADVGSDAWHSAVALARWLLIDPSGLGPSLAFVHEQFSEDRRRAFCRDVFTGIRDGELADRLAQARLLQLEDLSWWLAELADRLDGELAPALPPAAAHVLAELSWKVLEDDEQLAAARDFCSTRPALAAIAAEQFAEDVVDRRRALRRERAERQRRWDEEQASYRFEPDRLDVALEAGDFGAVLQEVRRHPGKDQRTPGPRGPVEAWSTMSADARLRVVELAATRLLSNDHDLSDYSAVDELAEALTLVGAASEFDGGPERWLGDVPPVRWNEWLPALMRSSIGVAAQICLGHALQHDPLGVEATLAAVLTGSAADVAHLTQWLLDELPADMLGRLAEVALTRAQDADVPVNALRPLLTFAQAGAPQRAAQAAVEHLGRCSEVPGPGPRDPEQPEIAAWSRAVTAARSLIASTALNEFLPDLLAAFDARPALALEAIRSSDAWQARRSWKGLTSPQLTELYLWARDTMPRPARRPGVAVTTDRAEEMQSDVLEILRGRTDQDSVQAYRQLADRTGEVYLRTEANQLAAQVASAASAPPSAAAVLTVLNEPGRRAVTTVEQLVAVVLAEIDALAEDLLRDRGLRSRFWEKQRDNTKWKGTWVPVEETDLSMQLKAELERRLEGRVAVVREVELQAKLGGTGTDNPDLLSIALTTDTAQLQLPGEVKGNYHDEVVESLQTQLADRYLDGPAGTVGIYLVGYFSGERWESTDSNRLRIARRHTIEELRNKLEAEAVAAAARGKTVHVRVIDIPLDLED